MTPLHGPFRLGRLPQYGHSHQLNQQTNQQQPDHQSWPAVHSTRVQQSGKRAKKDTQAKHSSSPPTAAPAPTASSTSEYVLSLCQPLASLPLVLRLLTSLATRQNRIRSKPKPAQHIIIHRFTLPISVSTIPPHTNLTAKKDNKRTKDIPKQAATSP
jgi:hypothetical protein